MLRSCRWAGLFFLFTVFVVPAPGADTKTSPGDKKSDTKTDDKPKEAYAVVNQVDGTVTMVSTPEKGITLQVVTRTPDPAAVQRLVQLQQQLAQQQATANRNNGFNRSQIQNTLVQINQQQLVVNKGKEEKADKQFDVSDEVKVRIAEPSQEFDSKGKRKKYTKEELARLKGPGNLWGFPATYDQLANGQYVKLVIMVKKSTVDAKKKKPAAKKKTDDDTSDDPPIVRQINIVSLKQN